MLYSYYSHLDKDAIQFDFIKFGEGIGYYGNKFEEEESKILSVPFLKNTSHIRMFVEILKKIKQFKGHDVIHVHRNEKSGIILFIAMILGFKNRIAHSHNYYENENFNQKIKNNFYKILTNFFATHKFACSNEAGSWLFGKNKGFTVIKNAIDLEKFEFKENCRHKIRDYYNLSRKFVIGNVGRISYQKNQVFIIDVFNEILKIQKESVLVLVGKKESESVYNEMQEKAKVYGIEDRVKFLGEQSNINKIMMGFDCFLFPSNHEGLGIVAVEAQASGLNVFVSTAIPKEVNQTNNIEYIPLKNGAKFWAKRILDKGINNDRGLDSLIDKMSDFNIRKQSKVLANIYKNLCD